MKLSFFLLLTCFLLQVSAQQKEVQAYYESINKAELCITHDKLDSSSYFFKKGFAQIGYPFARHVYNAAVVDANLKRYDNVYGYLKYILELGYVFDSLDKAPVFRDFFASPEGKKLRTLRPDIVPLYNAGYRKAIERMVADDQFFRVKSNSYQVYGDTIRKIDKRNVDELLKLIQQYGFPSESKVGVDPSTLKHPLYSVIMIHQTKGSFQVYNFKKVLLENILLGNIENKAGFYLIKRATGGYTEVVYKGVYVKVTDPTKTIIHSNNHTVLESSEYGYMPERAEKIEAFNLERQKVYLDSFEDNFRKVLFSLKFPQYKLSSIGSVELIVHQDRRLFLMDKALIKPFEK